MRYQIIILCAALFIAVALAGAPKPGAAAEARGSFTSTDGKTLYQENCQGCHMAAGQGAKGAGMYPALAGNPMLSAPEAPAHIILYGLRGMPSFDADYSDEQVAAVVNHIITSFGNKSETRLTPQAVRAMRPNPPIRY